MSISKIEVDKVECMGWFDGKAWFGGGLIPVVKGQYVSWGAPELRKRNWASRCSFKRGLLNGFGEKVETKWEC
jgi:hypothetical protein